MLIAQITPIGLTLGKTHIGSNNYYIDGLLRLHKRMMQLKDNSIKLKDSDHLSAYP